MKSFKSGMVLAGLSCLVMAANAGPTATDLNCSECVEAEELEAGAVGPRELAEDAVFARTLIIRSEGTPTENCNALLAALVDTSGADVDNRYLIKLEPGLYTCTFPEVVEMNAFVDIEGSGQDTTVIQGFNLPVVDVASNSELRQVSVVALGLARGIDIRGTNASLAHVSVEAIRTPDSSIPIGISIGPANLNSRSIEVDLDHVTVRAGLTRQTPPPVPGPIVGTAFQIGGPSRVRMTDVDAAGNRLGLNVVAANAAQVVATASKFRGRISSVRVEASNTAVIVSSQLIGPVGPGLGTLRCIGSYDSGFVLLGPIC